MSRLASILEEHGVPRAFEVRRELVNFKKARNFKRKALSRWPSKDRHHPSGVAQVCLHLFQNNTILEKELRQLSTFFFCDLVGGDKEVHTHSRHTHAHAYMRARACAYVRIHA